MNTLNLDPILTLFIRNNYLQEEYVDIFKAFTLIKTFNTSFYYDNLIELVVDDNLYIEDKIDIFKIKIYTELISIINSHGINTNKYIIPNLNMLNTIVECLYIIQHLESYNIIEDIIYSINSPLEIVLEIINHYTNLEKYLLMDYIITVDKEFIDNLNYIVNQHKELITYCNPCLNDIKAFIGFTNNIDCLGKQLFIHTLNNLTLKDLQLVVHENIKQHLVENVNNKGQVVVDILSLLINCTDAFMTPVEAFKEHYNIFIDDENTMLLIEPMLRKLVIDFTNYKTNINK